MKIILILGILISSKTWALEYYRTGNPNDVSTITQSQICLAGGGDDEKWVGGWKSLLKAANGGDVLIIRADTGRGDYEDWIYNDPSKLGLPKVNSVSTLVFSKRSEANSQFVVDKVNRAEYIFFSGGDQSDYVKFFNKTKFLKAVEERMNIKKIPIAGTSAGMAFLGGIDYTAIYNSPVDNESNVDSDDVLKDPTGKFVALENNILIPPYMKNILTDTHFSQRDRNGRLVGFMARAVYNRYEGVTSTSIKGIGSDEETAFCYNENGIGRVFGSGSVYFVKGNSPIEKIEKGSPLVWNNNQKALIVYEINAQSTDARFDLKDWKGTGGQFEYWWIENLLNGSNVFRTSK
jgi:cyanophycinase